MKEPHLEHVARQTAPAFLAAKVLRATASKCDRVRLALPCSSIRALGREAAAVRTPAAVDLICPPQPMVGRSYNVATLGSRARCVVRPES